MKVSRNRGSASKHQGSASSKRKATAQMEGSKRPRATSGLQQVDGAVDLTNFPTLNNNTYGNWDMQS